MGADFFAKGNKPISAYGSPNHGFKELWKGSSSTTFAGQTLTIDNIDTSRFDAIVIETMPWASELLGAFFQLFDLDVVSDGLSKYLRFDFNSDGKMQRLARTISFTITASSISIVVGNATRSIWNTYGNATATETTDNTKLIPYRILGLLHED